MAEPVQDEARVTKWRCPRCRLWVHEPIAKICALCKECIAEDAERDQA